MNFIDRRLPRGFLPFLRTASFSIGVNVYHFVLPHLVYLHSRQRKHYISYWFEVKPSLQSTSRILPGRTFHANDNPGKAYADACNYRDMMIPIVNESRCFFNSKTVSTAGFPGVRFHSDKKCLILQIGTWQKLVSIKAGESPEEVAKRLGNIRATIIDHTPSIVNYLSFSKRGMSTLDVFNHIFDQCAMSVQGDANA